MQKDISIFRDQTIVRMWDLLFEQLTERTMDGEPDEREFHDR
jgi:hypothetical protein